MKELLTRDVAIPALMLFCDVKISRTKAAEQINVGTCRRIQRMPCFNPMSRSHLACHGLTNFSFRWQKLIWKVDSDSLLRGRSESGPRGPKSGPIDYDNAVPGSGPRRC